MHTGSGAAAAKEGGSWNDVQVRGAVALLCVA